MKKTIEGKFILGIVLIASLVLIFLLAFKSEQDSISGFAALSPAAYSSVTTLDLRELKDFDMLRSLAPGSYYIDNNGIVYWTDDDSKPAVAKVNFADEAQKERRIYIDAEGRIGYVLEPVFTGDEQ
ncbi:hypothetical protein HYY71_04160 [Candidatus Woesearchaeota archaeon]|nr:hypothetical protein [Candidatus Woesearchaeota archaeon]